METRVDGSPARPLRHSFSMTTTPQAKPAHKKRQPALANAAAARCSHRFALPDGGGEGLHRMDGRAHGGTAQDVQTAIDAARSPSSACPSPPPATPADRSPATPAAQVHLADRIIDLADVQPPGEPAATCSVPTCCKAILTG